MSFINFSEVDVSNPDSWRGKKILSFDIDWCSDHVLNYVVDLIEKANVKATFFSTHKTEVLQRLKDNDLIEIGIHPNFNPLLDKEADAKFPVETLSEIQEIVGGAKVIRSHSMTHSGRWVEMYRKHGITHSSQYYMNGVNSIKPFRHVNGIVEVPVYFADDGYIFISDHRKWDNESIEEYLSTEDDYIKVYNFHPIHIALNTDSFSFYNETRDVHHNWEMLKKRKNNGAGAESILKQLLKVHV